MKTNPTQQSVDIVYTPSDVSNLALQELQERRDGAAKGIQTHIASLDAVMLPCRPGDLIVVIANSSHGKTQFMQYILRQEAKRIMSADPERENEIVVYVTWETAVEELGMYDISFYTRIPSDRLYQGNISDDEWQRLEEAAFKRAVAPIWVIGHSIQRRKKRPSLTMSNVLLSLRWIEEEFGLHPVLICLDYLQEMEPEVHTERRLQIFDCTSRAKDMALAMGCPVLLGCQAHRRVLEREWKLPRMNDGEETSAIEHTADKMISLWYPKMTESTSKPLCNTNLEVTNNLLIAGLMKQRYGKAGLWYPLHFRPDVNEIGSVAHIENDKAASNGTKRRDWDDELPG